MPESMKSEVAAPLVRPPPGGSFAGLASRQWAGSLHCLARIARFAPLSRPALQHLHPVQFRFLSSLLLAVTLLALMVIVLHHC